MMHRKAVGLPRFATGSKYYKQPSYNAIYNLLRQLDADLFAQTRTSSSSKKKTHEIAHYGSSQPAETRTPKQWLENIRNQWGGCEIRI